MVGSGSSKAVKMHPSSSTLYVVATPIGNLEDISARAIRILGEVDLMAAEDTRVSRVLLDKYGIKTPMFSCHKYNEGKRGEFFVSQLLLGKNIALISDAGVPCISDPGFRLVGLAHANGITVSGVCGPSSVMAALSVSGFDASCFTFIGFLPKGGAGKKALAEMINKGGTYVFFDSPKRIKKTLSAINEISKEVSVCLCNDLTKRFEKVYHGKISDVLDEVNANDNSEKGEYTCVISSSNQKVFCGEVTSIEAQIVDIMVKKGINMKEAAAELKTQNRKLQKKQIYSAVLSLKNSLQPI